VVAKQEMIKVFTLLEVDMLTINHGCAKPKDRSILAFIRTVQKFAHHPLSFPFVSKPAGGKLKPLVKTDICILWDER
jgi:hypothetical protein